MKIIDIGSAIRVLRPNAKFSIDGNTYEGIDHWDDGGENPPTEAEINAEIEKQEKEYDATAYQRTRAPLYPDIGDQLDDLYKKGAFSDDMAAKLKKVKDDNPKP